MLMYNEYPVNGAPHSKLVILVSHSLEPGRHRRVLLKEGVLRAKCVVGEGVEVDGAGDGETRVLWEARLPRDCWGGAGPTSACHPFCLLLKNWQG